MVDAVAGQERHPAVVERADVHGGGRRAVRGLDLVLGDVVEEGVEARPSEDADLGAAHGSVVRRSSRMTRPWSPSRRTSPCCRTSRSTCPMRSSCCPRWTRSPSRNPWTSCPSCRARARVGVLAGDRGLRLGRAPTAVGLVEALALERDAGGGEHLLEAPLAGGALGERIVGEGLDDVERLAAVTASVFVGGHEGTAVGTQGRGSARGYRLARCGAHRRDRAYGAPAVIRCDLWPTLRS